MIPIRVSISPRKTPYTNYVLIAANIIIFLLSYHPTPQRYGAQSFTEPLRAWAQAFELTPAQPQMWQFVTYSFLHGNWGHIIFNMYFLYMFGNNVNDKLGHTGYTCFYLAGAVFSGIGHAMLSSTPVLGASGAVAAVTGAYLVLFPKTLITIVYYMIIYFGTMELPAIYFIGLKMIVIDYFVARSTQGVAYNAHLFGYAYGITATILLLAMGLIPQHYADLLAMIKQTNRRRKYRDVVSGGYDPFKGRLQKKNVKGKDVKTEVEKEKDDKASKLRAETISFINQRNLSSAARVYMELTKKDRSQILPERYQLDIANQLMAMNQWECSAQAYENFLANYKNYQYLEQVELMLGILYSRYLRRKDDAIEHLTSASTRLTDPGQIKMCEEELAKLEK